MARAGLVDRVLLVGVHLEELPDALLLDLGRVQDLGAGGDSTGVHADEGQRPKEGVRGDLEGKRREGLFRARLPQDLLLLVARRVALHGGHIDRGRQVGDHGVEHRLNATVLERRATQDGVDLATDGERTNAGAQVLERELALLEVLLHQLVIGLRDPLDERVAVLLGLVLEVGGDLLNLVLGAHGDITLGVARPDQGTHLEQVDDTDEVVLGADRELEDQRLGAKAVHDGLHGEVEVRTQLVHLVDEADPGDVVLVGLTPHGLGLGLNALLAVEDRDRAIEDAQRALNLNGEVDVTRGVDDVDLVLVPEAGHRRGGDGDPPLLLLLHPVGGGSTVVGLTDLVVHPGVEEDALGHRGLTGVDVRHDADIANLLEVRQNVLCHFCLLISSVSANAVSAVPVCRPPVRRAAYESWDYQR